MKNKIWVLVLVILCCLSMVCLVACNNQTPDEGEKPSTTEHKHTFPTGWESNETHHWQECISSSCSEKQGYAEHDWKSNGGTPSTCTQAGTLKEVCSVCGEERGVNQATGHSYGEPTYTWADDNSAVTAKIVCINGCGDIIEEVVATTRQTTQNHSCDPAMAEQVTYTTQAFFSEKFTTQAKVVETKAAGHTFTALDSNETQHWYVCVDCGTEDTSQAKVDHTFNSIGKCECGAEKAYSVAEAKLVAEGSEVTVRGVVVGIASNFDGSGTTHLLVKDEATDEICSIRKGSEGNNALITGGTIQDPTNYFALGDIIEVPVLVKINKGASGAVVGGEHNKVMFIYMGESFTEENSADMVAKYKVGHTDTFGLDKSTAQLIDSQEALEAFVYSENYQYKLVRLHGTAENPLKAVIGAKTTGGKTDKDIWREYIFFFYGDVTAESGLALTDGKADKPCLSNFANRPYFETPLTELMFGVTEYSDVDFDNVLLFAGDVYCYVFGGSTNYIHFVVPDASYVERDADAVFHTKHEYAKYETDETQHWMVCSCGQADPAAEKVNHTYDEGTGLCVCGVQKAIEGAYTVLQAKNFPGTEVITVRAVVVGITGNYDNGMVYLIVKDEATDEICIIRRGAEKTDPVLWTGTSANQKNYFELGDIIEVPVTVHLNSATQGGAIGQKMFYYWGDNLTADNAAEVVAKYKKGHTDSFAMDTSKAQVIDSQEDLEAFLSTSGFSYKLVCLRGTTENPLKCVTGAATQTGKNDKDIWREYLRLFYDSPTTNDEVKIAGALPVLTNFANRQYMDKPLSEIVFGQTEYSDPVYETPYSFVGDIYCYIVGGSTAYFQFLIPDVATCVITASTAA